jgi:hypothetical protein
MFGSMIEYVLTRLSNDNAVKSPIKYDGSMHTFNKQWHPYAKDKLNDWPDSGITTPIYPFAEYHLPDIISQFKKHCASWHQDKKVLVYATDQIWCEINLLCQYHKISVGLNRGLKIFSDPDKKTFKQWDRNYESWDDMKPWQWREWFSIYYPQFVQEWTQSVKQVDDSWLCVSNKNLLENTESTLGKIAVFCDIKFTRPIKDFCREYISKQDYILKEYNTIRSITDAVLDNRQMAWQPISIIGEAILQQHFRQRGYEWYCDKLDILPCDSITFKKILYKPTKDLHA